MSEEKKKTISAEKKAPENKDIDPIRGVKKLNKKPLYITAAIILAALVMLSYAIVQRENKTKKKKQKNQNTVVQQDSRAYKDIIDTIPQSYVGDLNEAPTEKEEGNGNEISDVERRLLQKLKEQEEMIKSLKLSNKSKATQVGSASMRISGGKTRLAPPKPVTSEVKKSLPSLKDIMAKPQITKLEAENKNLRSRMEDLLAPKLADELVEFYDEEIDYGFGGEAKRVYDRRTQDTSYIHTFKVQEPVTHLELKTGTIIPATLITGINSEHPGAIIAQVNNHVYDTHSGQHLLIPQGSRLYGKYGRADNAGASRVYFNWNRLIFPNGDSLTLGSIAGIDMEGNTGVEDKVNRHFLRNLTTSVMLSGVSLGLHSVTGSTQATNLNNLNNLSTQQIAANQVSINMGRIINQQIRRAFNRAPTLTIRPGYRLAVIVTKDLGFEKEHEDHMTFSISSDNALKQKVQYFNPNDREYSNEVIYTK